MGGGAVNRAAPEGVGGGGGGEEGLSGFLLPARPSSETPSVLVITHPTFFTFSGDGALPLTMVTVLPSHDCCMYSPSMAYFSSSDVASFSRYGREFCWVTHRLSSQLLTAPGHEGGGQEGARIFRMRLPCMCSLETTQALSTDWPVVWGKRPTFSI